MYTNFPCNLCDKTKYMHETHGNIITCFRCHYYIPLNYIIGCCSLCFQNTKGIIYNNEKFCRRCFYYYMSMHIIRCQRCTEISICKEFETSVDGNMQVINLCQKCSTGEISKLDSQLRDESKNKDKWKQKSIYDYKFVNFKKHKNFDVKWRQTFIDDFIKTT